MAIVVEILLASESFPLVKTARTLPNQEITLSQVVRLENSQYLFMLSIAADTQAAFDAVISDQPEVIDATSVGQTPDGWFYQIVTDQGSDFFQSHDPHQFEGTLMEATITGEGWVEWMVFTDYNVFNMFRDHCQIHNIPFELLNISSVPKNPDVRAQFDLTDRQYEAMAVAFLLGYYDTPRAINRGGRTRTQYFSTCTFRSASPSRTLTNQSNSRPTKDPKYY